MVGRQLVNQLYCSRVPEESAPVLAVAIGTAVVVYWSVGNVGLPLIYLAFAEHASFP